MTRVNGGDILIATLQKLDVDTIFTLHGGHLDCAFKAAVEQGIGLVDTRHEQAAGIAATGYARATGKVGVAMITAGGGVSNVVTAIANAYADCVASVFIGGAPPLQDSDTLPVNSGYDQMSLMGGITKWSRRVTHINRLSEYVARAFQIAREGRPGPVYLDLPSDVLYATLPQDDVQYWGNQPALAAAAPAPQAIATVLERLQSAQRPVILAGGGAVYAGAANSLFQFAERAGIPILTNNKSRGLVPTQHRLNARGFGALGAAAGRGAGEPDVILVLGARLGLYTGGQRRSVIPKGAYVIQADICAEEIGRIREVDLGIVSDIAAFVDALSTASQNAAWPDWAGWADALRGPEVEAATSETVLTPDTLSRAVAQAIPAGAITLVDGGETPSWLDGVAHSNTAQRWLGHGYLGVMGEGMPLAIGAQVAHPDKRVICFAGDGAIGFNFAEFDTMVRHNLPVIVIVNNDQQWAMSAHGQDLMWGEGNRIVSGLAATRYDLAAAGFGAHAEYVTEIAQFAPAFERAAASGLPACINVMTAPLMHGITRRMIGLAGQGPLGTDGRARVPYADVLEV